MKAWYFSPIKRAWIEISGIGFSNVNVARHLGYLVAFGKGQKWKPLEFLSRFMPGSTNFKQAFGEKAFRIKDLGGGPANPLINKDFFGAINDLGGLAWILIRILLQFVTL